MDAATVADRSSDAPNTATPTLSASEGTNRHAASSEITANAPDERPPPQSNNMKAVRTFAPEEANCSISA